MCYLRGPASYSTSLLLVSAIIVAALSAPVWAGEKGKWRGRAALVSTKQETVKVEDQAEHAIYLSEADGVIFNDSGESFLEKARYQYVYLLDTGGMVSGGYKTFTATDGSKVFVKFEEHAVTPPTYKGKWQFIGGTGKYQGIKGQGVYTYTEISPTTGWDVLEGEYELP